MVSMPVDSLVEAVGSSLISEYANRSVEAIASVHALEGVLREVLDRTWKCVERGGTIFWCGNGGSAADAQHLAAELVGRFESERAPIRSLALTSDTSVLTALANDYSYERVFARQVEALARPGDVLFALSTSGNSPNVVAALRAARVAGMTSVSMTGKKPSSCCAESDLCLQIAADATSNVQEAHIVIGHALCSAIESLWVESGH